MEVDFLNPTMTLSKESQHRPRQADALLPVWHAIMLGHVRGGALYRTTAELPMEPLASSQAICGPSHMYY